MGRVSSLEDIPEDPPEDTFVDHLGGHALQGVLLKGHPQNFIYLSKTLFTCVIEAGRCFGSSKSI
jgi:hypothetical protein